MKRIVPNDQMSMAGLASTNAYGSAAGETGCSIGCTKPACVTSSTRKVRTTNATAVRPLPGSCTRGAIFAHSSVPRFGGLALGSGASGA